MAWVDGNLVVIDIRVPDSPAVMSTRVCVVGRFGWGTPSASAKPSSSSRWCGASTPSTFHQPCDVSPAGPVMW